MNRLFTLALAAAGTLASVGSVAYAGTATFGLCIWPYYKCGKCQVCPGPYNAFSPNCYGVENAAGCTACAPGYGYPGAGGPHDGQFGYSRGWHGLQPKGFFGLCGHGNGAPMDLGVPYPCGAIAAFHGVPGEGGAGDPFGGCGTKRKLCHRIADWNGKHTAGVGLDGVSWGKGFFGKLKDKHFGHKLGGGCDTCDGTIESSPLIATYNSTEPQQAAAPAAQAPRFQQVGYQPRPAYYPNPGYGYYHQMYQPAYYMTPWGCFPAYGQPMGY